MGGPTAVYQLLSTYSFPFAPLFTVFLLPYMHLFSYKLHIVVSLSLSLFPPSHSWIGHIQGSNESTQRCLQEACFQRPSWITVTMEISTTMVSQRDTHRCGALDSSATKCIHSKRISLCTVCRHTT